MGDSMTEQEKLARIRVLVDGCGPVFQQMMTHLAVFLQNPGLSIGMADLSIQLMNIDNVLKDQPEVTKEQMLIEAKARFDKAHAEAESRVDDAFEQKKN